MAKKNITNPPDNSNYEKLDDYYTNYETQELLDANILKEASSEEYNEIQNILGPKPKKGQINFRMNEEDLNKLKKVADFKAIPYGTLARSWIIERLRSEIKTIENES